MTVKVSRQRQCQGDPNESCTNRTAWQCDNCGLPACSDHLEYWKDEAWCSCCADTFIMSQADRVEQRANLRFELRFDDGLLVL